MSAGEIIFASMAGVALNGVIAMFISAESRLGFDEAFWWPILSAKILLKSLWRTLVEDWKP